MDCFETMADSWVFLDHECADDHAHALCEHLIRCDRCLSGFRGQALFKERVRRACGGDHAPIHLRVRVRGLLAGPHARARRCDGGGCDSAHHRGVSCES
ncbi:hypothetical protein [Nocardia terpenica]|uniref:Zinc-finger domain-containing protein n=1 Tax=Nocardia terpenica TaxID=455432 RepID=A0A6G9ZDH3_9NOCA|nr:hypothetical protein [Nocardia terpenica]QIS23053.1 hypothetical protein F6W96_36650 [Nocardia terpenica]